MEATSGAAALERWIASGGHWKVLTEGDRLVTVGLFSCDGGQEMERVVLSRDELPESP